MTTPQPTVAPTVEQVMAAANSYAEHLSIVPPLVQTGGAAEAAALWKELRQTVEALAVDAERWKIVEPHLSFGSMAIMFGSNRTFPNIDTPTNQSFIDAIDARVAAAFIASTMEPS